MKQASTYLVTLILAAVIILPLPAQSQDLIVSQLEVGLELLRVGQREKAFTHFEQLLDSYNSEQVLSSEQLAAVATAASQLGIKEPQLFKDAVRVFDEAIAKDPNNIDARVALGNLLLEKYNNTEAAKVFIEALALRANHSGALLGLARSQHFDHSSDAMETVIRSLEADPQSVATLTFLARLFIELEQYDKAIEQLGTALNINPQSLPALSVLATAYYLNGEQGKFQAIEQQVLGINPNYAEFYNTLAELAERNRLYAAAVDFAARAVELDELSWRGYGLLGNNQTRIGAVAEGIANMEKSFAGDPYNLWIKNSLDFADTLTEYDLVQTDVFTILLHKSESALLAPYVIELAQQAYDFYRQQYEHQPQLPIRIELYPRHADFSVRTLGLAGLGILGVSFGPVVAMDSPSARQLGHFNWGSTLWHELAHTFHLGMTDNRVPRWFSEGLSVYEERQARPGWGGDVDGEFLAAYRDKKLLPVSELNNGFVRPSYPQQVIHSYYQSSLVFDFIVRDWGFSAVRTMLSGYKKRLSHDDVILLALGISAAEFDTAFDNYFRRTFAIPLAALAPLQREMEYPGTPNAMVRRAYWQNNNYSLQLQAGQYLAEKEDYPAAIFFLKRARALFPGYAGEDSAYWLLAQIYEHQGDPIQAAEQLRQMTAVNGEYYPAYLKLAEFNRLVGDNLGAAEALQQAMYIHPYDISLHEKLAQLYADLQRWLPAARERRAVVALQPVDVAEARYQLANAYYHSNDLAMARREVLQALEVAPNYDAALDLLLNIREQRQTTTIVQ